MFLFTSPPPFTPSVFLAFPSWLTRSIVGRKIHTYEDIQLNKTMMKNRIQYQLRQVLSVSSPLPFLFLFFSSANSLICIFALRLVHSGTVCLVH